MEIESDVQHHYTHGNLLQTILAALQKAGRSVEPLDRADLGGADELHFGWQPATAEIARDLCLSAGTRVLDIGSGVGGPARHFAAVHEAEVTGIDLTPEFVAVATDLTRRCGLADRASFQVGSALEMPFDDARFDCASLIHVGMNVEDKARLFGEARRVLKKGGLFAVYDLMRTGAGDLPYPMPWAATEATSFVASPQAYSHLLGAAGFAVEAETDRRAMGLELARQMREKAEREGPPILGLQTLMGPTALQRMGNVMAAVSNGILSPIQILVRAV